MKILERLNPTNTGSYNRPIAHALGLGAAVVYAALISKQVYYEQHNMLLDDGWFYSTVADLHESTAMAKCKQASAIKLLTDAGLIECCKRGMPARRYFRVCDNVELLNEYLEQGNEIMTELNPAAQSDEKRPTCCKKTERQASGFCDNKSAENEMSIINHNIIKSKDNNPNPSIISDGTDMTGNSQILFSSDERSDYRDIIRENIEYDCLSEDKARVDELVEIMLDVVCSTKSTTRVNGEEIPTGTVKSRFLKLTHEHIEYVLTALGNNTSDVRNIRAYLITALYNAPITMDSYYTALVNHDMYGKPDNPE